MGLNGSGKSTIFEMLAGQTRMSAGKAVIYEYEFPNNLEMVRINLTFNLKLSIDIWQKIVYFLSILKRYDIYPTVEISII